MNIRIKFYGFSSFTKRDLQSLDQYFSSKAFTADKPQGFLKDEFTSTSWTGRYIRKNQYSEELTDPFGKKYIMDRVVFDEIPFRISLEWPHIEIFSQFRLCALLLNKLAEAIEFDRSLLPVEFNFQKLFKVIKTNFKSATVTSLLIGEIVVSPYSVAKFHVEGNEDVRQHIDEILAKKKYKILSAKMRWTESEQEIIAKFDISGKVEISGPTSKMILPSLRSILRKTNDSIS